jgi:hypothetical protein
VACSWGRNVFAYICRRAGSRFTARLALCFLISLTAVLSHVRQVSAAERRSRSLQTSQFSTTSERVATRTAGGISLAFIEGGDDAPMDFNLATTMASQVAGAAAVRALDASVVAPQTVVRSVNLESVAANRQGFLALQPTKVQGARRNSQPSGVAAAQLVKLGLVDPAERSSSVMSPLSRGSATSSIPNHSPALAMGGVQRNSAFSTAAVVEPVSHLTSISSHSHLNFSSESGSSSLLPIASPMQYGVGMINLAQ